MLVTVSSADALPCLRRGEDTHERVGDGRTVNSFVTGWSETDAVEMASGHSPPVNPSLQVDDVSIFIERPFAEHCLK